MNGFLRHRQFLLTVDSHCLHVILTRVTVLATAHFIYFFSSDSAWISSLTNRCISLPFLKLSIWLMGMGFDALAVIYFHPSCRWTSKRICNRRKGHGMRQLAHTFNTRIYCRDWKYIPTMQQIPSTQRWSDKTSQQIDRHSLWVMSYFFSLSIIIQLLCPNGSDSLHSLSCSMIQLICMSHASVFTTNCPSGLCKYWQRTKMHLCFV